MGLLYTDCIHSDDLHLKKNSTRVSNRIKRVNMRELGETENAWFCTEYSTRY
jgi:hypothetical protein